MARKKARPSTARVRGALRAAHFAAGGTPAEWRGVKAVHRDRRKEGSKLACRGRWRRNRDSTW